MHYKRMRSAEHAPSDLCRVLEHRHSLAEILERGAVVQTETPRVIQSHSERDYMTLSEDTFRHGPHFAQKCLGFFEAV